jgi:hypothetical protein
MKKLMTIAALVILSASYAKAAQVHYLQDVQMDKNAKFGVNASSANPYDATLILKNAASDNTTVIKSTESTGYNLYMPASGGSDGQVLATESNGQLKWTSVSTVTVNDAVSQSLQAIANSTHTGITAAYTAPNTLNLSLSSSVVLDGQNANLNVLTVSSMTATGSITAGNIVNQGSLYTGSVTSTGTITTDEDIAIARDKKIILNKDQTGNSYISQQTGDNSLEFFKNGVLYMRFED